MSKGEINISISGGKADFGNITQGDKNSISLEQHKDCLNDFYAEILELSASSKIAEDQVHALKKEIKSLTENSNKESFPAIAKKLYKQYSWALEPLKKLFSVMLP